MVRRGALCCLAVVGSLAQAASGQELDAHGYADTRAVVPFGQRSSFDGGQGKLRFGGNTPSVRFSEAALDSTIKLVPGVDAFASLRLAPDQKTRLDVVEGFLRYQPLISASWLVSIKTGAFFPPISLENEGVGWASPWTLTPSAINTWVGEELRTLGSEVTIERRLDARRFSLIGAVYAWNDPAGVLINERGWALNDRPTGLFDNLRLPDQISRRGVVSRSFAREFKDIDDQPGWYAGLSWTENDVGRLAISYYDNRANPAATREGQIGWRTQFTSLGIDTGIGDVVILAQAMAGDTEFAPSPRFRSVTRFQSGYLLVGRYFDDWRVAVRIDGFATQEHRTVGRPLSERGYAAVAAVTWNPVPWLRLTGEGLVIESVRPSRAATGASPRAEEALVQFSVRTSF